MITFVMNGKNRKPGLKLGVISLGSVVLLLFFFCIKYVVIYGPLGRRSCGLWVFLMNLELFLSKSNIGIAPEFVWIE